MSIGKEEMEELKGFIREELEKRDKAVAALKNTLDAMTTFNGKQMLDSQDMRLFLQVCDRTQLRWRLEGRLPYFKIGRKIYYWASDVQKFIKEEYRTLSK